MGVGVVSLLLAFATPFALLISVVIFFLAYYYYYYYYDKSRQETTAVQSEREKINAFASEHNPKFDLLANDIFGELSSKHSSKQSTLSETHVTVQREIERETVRIRCPYCRTLNADSQTLCSRCGARL